MRAGHRTGQGGRGAIGAPDPNLSPPAVPEMQHRGSGIARSGLGQARRAPEVPVFSLIYSFILL